jgi:hypothetical protein
MLEIIFYNYLFIFTAPWISRTKTENNGGHCANSSKTQGTTVVDDGLLT